LHPRQHGGGRQRHRLGQLQVGHAPVVLQAFRMRRSMRSISASDSVIDSELFGLLAEFSVKFTIEQFTIGGIHHFHGVFMPDAAPTDSPAAAAPGRPKQGEQHAQGPEFNRLPFPYRPEADTVSDRLHSLQGALDWAAAARRPRPGCRRCAKTRRRSGRWRACSRNTRFPAPKAWP
jgi:hypothetical protein